MAKRFRATFHPLLLGLFVALACGGSASKEPSVGDSSGAVGRSTSDANSSSSSGSGVVVGTGGSPNRDVSQQGQAGAPVKLPAFDCSDPGFFPLRIDDKGNPIDHEEEQVEHDELGAGGSGSGSGVGSGDLTVLLVFDKSGSMASGWGGKSRWQAGSDAVLLGLDGILDQITLGALFFPFDEEGVTSGCGVPPITLRPQIDFMTGRGFKESWIGSACAAQPHGSTPLEHALERADQAIMSAQQRGLMKERMRVLLVTDGEPTCQDNVEAIVAFPTKWFEMGIETLVIGLPGSQAAHQLLDAIAEAGGTEEHSSPVQIGEFEGKVYDALR